MKDRSEDLEPEVASAIVDELSNQARECLNKIAEIDWKLTQHNFFVNAGGAAAILAYLGTSPAPTYAVWPLALFVGGIIASGIEIRALLGIFSALHSDALRRRAGFVGNELAVEDSVPKHDVTGCWKHINHWSGVISQVSFVLGSIVGIGLFLWKSP
jgi:hypothetical protein